VQHEIWLKRLESRYQLGAVCGKSRTYSSEGEVSRSNTGIDSNSWGVSSRRY
jgi:hypothetical protein